VSDPAANDPAANDDRPSPNRRALLISGVVVAGLLAVAAVAAGPAIAPGVPTYPPVGVTPGPAGGAAAATRSSIAAALAAENIQVEDVTSPYRPAEGARFAAAPRLVVRAVMPADPDRGRVVIYQFLGTGEATAAAQEQAAYVSSAVGQVQFALDARFALRVVGSTVVFYAWSPGSSADPERAAAVATALETLGFGVSAPR